MIYDCFKTCNILIGMKKLLLILLCILISNNIFAQSNSIGVFGGINVSNMKIENYSNNDSKSLTRFVCGIKYQRVFRKPFVIDAGIVYNTIGCKIEVNWRNENNEDLGTYDTPWIHRYVSIPVTFGYRFGDTFSIIPKIGIQMSYLIDSRIKGTNNGVMYDNKIDLEYYNRFDFAGVVDVELCYDFNSNLGVFFDLSGKYSFTNSANFVNIYKDTTFYHYSLSTVLGVKYSF